MNKNELITAIAEETGVAKKDVTAITSAVFDKLAEAMAKKMPLYL